ncbi:hypothetical protein IEQ34_006631 [Dendrobium chrysotoxum]|uniref:Uncharacterized protein n=1 Tax=Dendrobium chrysotoxum TaxID=161865 RepID=A0AAV7GPP2_DENCH|nr:hypothetical protein IEQ34_006631 [Dendrobium chrysotoxum]
MPLVSVSFRLKFKSEASLSFLPPQPLFPVPGLLCLFLDLLFNFLSRAAPRNRRGGILLD